MLCGTHVGSWVRFGAHPAIATYIADSPTGPGYPHQDRKATWLVGSKKDGGGAATEVADAWHGISYEVEEPGRVAQQRALSCIS